MGKKHSHNEPLIAPESLGLPRTGVDSHAHLDLRHFAEDLDAVLDRAAASGVERIGNVFLNTEAWEKGREYFADRPELFFLLGIHPTDAALWTDETPSRFAGAFAVDPRLRALGEIGLDFYWKDCPPEVQTRVFIAQLRFAANLDRQGDSGNASGPLPVVIHSRDAFDETMAVLRGEGFSGYPVLWHCFGGNADQAGAIIGEGWHISIPGPVTFKSNADLREALHAIPPSRLLLETDCPYLSPMPYRGKRNEPAYSVFTAQAVARELGMETADLWTLCGNNAKRFFGL